MITAKEKIQGIVYPLAPDKGILSSKSPQAWNLVAQIPLVRGEAPETPCLREEQTMRTRSRHVSVWMTDEEYKHLKKQVALAGLGIDPFIRNLVQGISLRPKPPETYAALLRELSAIGNNINQLTHQANARGEAVREEIQEAARLVRQVARLVKRSL